MVLESAAMGSVAGVCDEDCQGAGGGRDSADAGTESNRLHWQGGEISEPRTTSIPSIYRLAFSS